MEVLMPDTVPFDVVKPANDRAMVVSPESRWRAPLAPAMDQLRASIERDGYAFAAGAGVRDALAIDAGELQALVAAGNDLAVDRYDKTASRLRAYSQGHLFPWSRDFVWVPSFVDSPGAAPHTVYVQDQTFNQEFGNVHRRFMPIPDRVRTNRALHKLIHGLWETLPGWRKEAPRDLSVLVGVHLVKLAAEGSRAAIASPPTLHIDGEPWTFVVLLERHNVQGGRSYVAQRHCAGKYPDDVASGDLLFEKELTDCLDTLAIDDSAISHTVSGIRSLDCKPAWRTALFIDYSPLHPMRTAAA
jgi:hypothetical protein